MKLIINSVFYSFLSVFQAFVGFLLIPLFMVYFNQSEYGIYSVLMSVTSLLNLVFCLSLTAALSRFHFNFVLEQEKIKELYGTILKFTLIFSFLISLILVTTIVVFDIHFFSNIPFCPYLIISILSSFLFPVYSLYLTILQTEQKGKIYTLVSLFYFILNLILTLFFVVFIKLQVLGPILAIAVTNFIFFIISVICMIPKIKFTINFSILKECLDYCLPLIPHSIASWVLTYFDKIIINQLLGSILAGIYFVGYQISSILMLISDSINKAFVPWFFDELKKSSDNKHKVSQLTEFIIILYCLMALTFSLFSNEILYILSNSKYYGASQVIPLLSFAFVFNGLYYFFVNPLFYNIKGTRLVPLATIATGLMSILLNWLFIPKLGILGSALACFISFFFSSVFVLIITQKIEKMPYNWIKLYLIIFLSFGISFIHLHFDKFRNFLLLIGIKIFILAFILLILYKFYRNTIFTFFQILFIKKNKD